MSLSDLYSPKQIKVLSAYHNRNPFMIINSGAVRTGKTFIDNDLFLFELIRLKAHAKKKGIREPLYILAGANIGALERNVLTPLREKYNFTIKLNKFNQFKLFDTVVCCFGHDDIGNLSTITGMTANGAYINEATKARYEVLDEIIKRCSGVQGFETKIIMDTNPDSPVHPIKTNWIDKADGKNIIYNNWTLDDNPFLTESYKENIKLTTPTGVFFDRKIKGLWVSAEGVVYQDFDANKHYINDLSKFKFKSYFAGVDWGYKHFGAIVLLGLTYAGEVVVLKEYAKQQKEIDYWVDIAKEIKNNFGNIPFYCDTARPEYIEKFRRSGINAKEADKAVLSGIEFVASLLKQYKLLIYKPAVQRFNEEIYNYIWKSVEEKEDVKKVYDDVLDAIRYAIYTHFKKKDTTIKGVY